jgi:hypothetical protein
MSEDARRNPTQPAIAAAATRRRRPVADLEIVAEVTPNSDSGVSLSHDKEDGCPSEGNDLSTLRTVASSPASSGVDDTDFTGLVVETGGRVMAASQQSTSSSGLLGRDGGGNDREDGELMPPVMMMSQTDQHIRQLDQGGELNEVAGSQSMLSQELMYQVSSQQDVEDDEGSDNGDDEGGALHGNTFHLSQQTETSIGMAQRLGLLSQTQDDDDDAVEVGRSQGNYGEDPAQRHTATKGHISGLDLLTRAGSNEAAALMSFSQEFATGTTTSKQSELRESEGFGSLLDAVAKITEQEEVVDILTPTWENAASSLDYASLPPSRDKSYLLPPSSSSPRLKNAVSSSRVDSPKKKRQVRKSITAAPKRSLNESNPAASKTKKASSSKSSSSKDSKRKMPPNASKSSSSSNDGSNNAAVSTKRSPSKKRKSTIPATTRAPNSQKLDETERKNECNRLRMEQKEIDMDISRAQAEAKRAADLAERTISDPVIAKRLLLSMALVRENPRSVPDVLPGPGHVLQEGFFWAHYPPLELVLKR